MKIQEEVTFLVHSHYRLQTKYCSKEGNWISIPIPITSIKMCLLQHGANMSLEPLPYHHFEIHFSAEAND